MESPSLAELSDKAATVSDPAFTSQLETKPGGVDPLGLRQINFDLMDRVFPGVNNIGRHIRPYTVVTWAWHRAAICARDLGQVRASVSDLQDFVDRIEVIYAWSQFLRGNVDLPGRTVLAPLISAGHYEFGGEAWKKRREKREDSTGLSAPINYGPALKALGWLRPDSEQKGALLADPMTYEAIAAFEHQLAGQLLHPAFSQFGSITITNAEVKQLADLWALDAPTDAERRLMAASLVGSANRYRRDGAKLAVAAAVHLGNGKNLLGVRRTMCGAPTDFFPPLEFESAAQEWRAVQVRQTFRLALEALLHWILRSLDGTPRTTAGLVESFLQGAGDAQTTEEWLRLAFIDATGPADWVHILENSLSPLDDEIELLSVIRSALAMSISEAPTNAGAERDDRLPLARAAKEVRDRKDESPKTFLAHVFESWIFGQHAYWSIGRGLADARGRGKNILRLKVTLEEGGWTLAPGAKVGDRGAPEATGDRLETVVTLLREAGLIT